MFKKVLIANRGEIACRILGTLKRLGIASVAVYSEVDRTSRHVLDADEAVLVGPAPAAQSYLARAAIIQAAVHARAEAIIPGYGFLSENPEFAEQVEAAGLVFVGPTPAQMRQFGLKHAARAMAKQVGVPLLPGSALLENYAEAERVAQHLGYPLMLKSTAGGGGIGMQLCRGPDELLARFESVRSLAQKNFADGGLFLERFVERARHIEVQLFGDGHGHVVALGERDCSAQRRNQKVIEESPAPRLDDSVRQSLHAAAIALGRAVNYRSAGTVEFVYDDALREYYFLEVNTRLQVEHGVTELVYGVDLVEWMLRLAADDGFQPVVPPPRGHAIEVRLYAEDPARGFQPSAGLLTEVRFPGDARVDGWVESGSEVSAYYDPMLAKLLVCGDDRASAVVRLTAALAQTSLVGIETNLDYLRSIVNTRTFSDGQVTTAYLGRLSYTSPSVEVLKPGTQSMIQDYPGRLGYWDVGIPPSGPMDDWSFRLTNRAVGNASGAAALEVAMTGPTLKFAHDAVISVGGADFQTTLDGALVPRYAPIQVRSGQVLAMGSCTGPGCRAYLAVRHGFDVPMYLGSRSTFPLGGFGGHAGRALRKGDVLHLANEGAVVDAPQVLSHEIHPPLTDTWTIAVHYGPHGAPDFFHPDGIDQLFETSWEIHYNSARTGVRLIGPKPRWARLDGGEAGLHPSNLHDNGYAFGTIDFTGDMPILLGPDGPSLGGFVCPATVVAAERWKLGQLRPGARVRFIPITIAQAAELEAQQLDVIERRVATPVVTLQRAAVTSAVLRREPASLTRPEVTYRPAGDKFLLVEYGPMTLELRLRFRVHLLMQRLRAERIDAIVDLTPGIRSLLIQYDSRTLPLKRLLDRLTRLDEELPNEDAVTVPTRVVHLPLSWDDPATRLAIERYMQGVRPDAPWTPSNLEFIRRINGLGSIDDVKRIVFDASYLVLGLGDVYLGAPVATPIDPRHRLVTTKYNPARTFTPENAVGIGGAYLCVYGMQGPGGYQFVGRTIQMFNRFRVTKDFEAGRPWLLRFFDQIRFYAVSAQELLEMREAFPHGRLALDIREARFSLAEYQAQLKTDATSIHAFQTTQRTAFDAERRRWQEQDEEARAALSTERPSLQPILADGEEAVESHVQGSIWKVNVKPGDWVKLGEPLMILESMKMEIAIESPLSGRVARVLGAEGQAVVCGQPVVSIIAGSTAEAQ